MEILVAPIPEENIASWKAWATQLQEGEEFKEQMNRMKLTRHDAWLAHSPGGPVVVVVWEGEGEKEFLANMMASDHPADKAHLKKAGQLHGVDFDAPPPSDAPPTPELGLDSQAMRFM